MIIFKNTYYISLLLMGIMTMVSCNNDDDIIDNSITTPKEVKIEVEIDLVNIVDDKSLVEVYPEDITENVITYFMPKVVPGVHMNLNFGRLIEDFKAFDESGKELVVEKSGDNTWKINNAASLEKITYYVNDSYDAPEAETYSDSAGTNIEEPENFVINFNGFVGYFEGYVEAPYTVEITRPSTLEGITTLTKTESENGELPNTTEDEFIAKRYAELVDNPLMYAKPNSISFMVDDVAVTFSIYSPNNVHQAETYRSSLEKLMRAQKKFMGTLKTPNVYKIILFLYPQDDPLLGIDAGLEHNTSTFLVLEEEKTTEELTETLEHVVSHEFFHILIPLSIHSEEIHYFNFNNPVMSQHLWFYEGVVEYLSHIFRAQAGIIPRDEFINHNVDYYVKSNHWFSDTPLTTMSKDVLNGVDPYVFYMRAVMMAMYLDIQIIEHSNGKRNIMDLIGDLANVYGPDKPFVDDELFAEITRFTHPEMMTYLEKYIGGNEALLIDDAFYLNKVGVGYKKVTEDCYYFSDSNKVFFDYNRDTKQFFIPQNITLNTGLIDIGIKNGDILKRINGKEVTIETFADIFDGDQYNWPVGTPLKFEVIRDGQEVILEGTAIQPQSQIDVITELDIDANDPRFTLREKWLTGINGRAFNY